MDKPDEENQAQTSFIPIMGTATDPGFQLPQFIPVLTQAPQECILPRVLKLIMYGLILVLLALQIITMVRVADLREVQRIPVLLRCTENICFCTFPKNST